MAEAMLWPWKDPDEVLDYGIDWSRVLENDPIQSSQWIFESGQGTLVINSSEHDETTAVAWFSGGTVNTEALLVNRITTLGGRTLDQSVRLPIQTR